MPRRLTPNRDSQIATETTRVAKLVVSHHADDNNDGNENVAIAVVTHENHKTTWWGARAPLVDLGSQISLIAFSQYKHLLSSQSPVRSHDATRLRCTLITCFGYLEAPAEYGGNRIPSLLFYVTKRGDCLLGAYVFDRLGFGFLEPYRPNAFAQNGEVRNVCIFSKA
jgi:hypothetical protein